MFKLAAVFSPGFEKVIPKALKDVLPDAYNLNVSSGFLRFCTDKNPFRAVNADFLNNSFLVLKEWNGDSKNAKGGLNKAPAFEVMANKIRIPDQLIPEITKQHYKTFRLRFSQANVFTSVNKNVMANVEKQISKATGMKPDRLGGDTEFWFLTRTDGYACFALRMTKKQSTEKYLEKGELRPEFVTLLAAFADTDGELRKASSAKATATRYNGGVTPIGAHDASTGAKATATRNNGATAPTGAHDASTSAPSDSQNDAQRPVMLDPFAGHGGIVKRLAQMYPKAQILASELDGDLAEKLKGCRQADATNLFYLEDNSVDCVITDPPWGFWQGDLRDDKKLRALYDGMLKEMFRVTKPGASLCILTAAKEVFEAAFDASSFAGAHNAVATPAHNTAARHNAVSEGTSDLCTPGGQAAHNAVATPAHNAAARHNAVSEGTPDIRAPGGQAAYNAVATPAYKAADIRNDVLVNGKKAAVYVWHK